MKDVGGYMNDSDGSVRAVWFFFPRRKGEVSYFFVITPIEVAVKEVHQLAIC